MIEICGVPFGGQSVPVLAGPCSVESEEQLRTIASSLSEIRVPFLRGGLFKLRTNPKSFQGLGEAGFEIAKSISEHFKMPFTTEITDIRQIEKLYDVASIFQVGTRNMYNYDLLKELGKSKKPVLLKRAFSCLLYTSDAADD